MAQCTIKPSVPGQGEYAIVLTQTSPTQALMDISMWPYLSDRSGPPASDNGYDLANIMSVGGVLTCSITESFLPFMNPQLTISMSGVGQPAAVTIATTHAAIYNGSTTYALTETDLVALKTWLVECNFPSS